MSSHYDSYGKGYFMCYNGNYNKKQKRELEQI